MQFSIQARRGTSAPDGAWQISSISVGVVAIILAIGTFSIHRVELGQALLAFSIAVFCLVVAVHARFLYLARKQYRLTTDSLQAKEREFQSVFENALDAILILDNHGICLDANPSTLQLLSVRGDQIIGQPIAAFYADRHAFDSSWEQLLSQQRSRGRCEVVSTDSAHLFVEFTGTAHFLPDRHVMIFRDITQQRRAEEAKDKSLALAKSAWQEADALRKATLALTQDLRMNSVLDKLLEALHEFVPFEAAQVLLLETDSKLFLAREVVRQGSRAQPGMYPETLDASQHRAIEQALKSREGIVIADAAEEGAWASINAEMPVGSWLGIPLRSSDQVLGLLSLSHTKPGRFTLEHLRVSGSLAVAAAVAIQNARLYEHAEIYRAELERRLSELDQAHKALDQLRARHGASDN